MLTFTRNRNGSTWEANCDGCPEGADLDTGSFERAKGHLKARGWVTAPKLPIRDKPVWQHFCPGCAKERESEIGMARDALRLRGGGR